MNRLRLASCTLLTSLSFLSGCHTCGCGYGNGNGGFFSRLTSRRAAIVTETPLVGTPISSYPIGGYPIANGGCWEGGPILSDPGMISGPISGGVINGPSHGIISTPGTAIPSTNNGFSTQPPVMNTPPPPLAPVPGTNAGPGMARPLPADPMTRSK